MKLYYNQQLTTLSRELRKNSTLDEVLLWKELKNKKTGYPFMRQKPILSYIVDFYCAPLRLAIEIDGSTHDVKIESDIVRQSALEKLGIVFLRFSEGEVRNNLDGVVLQIAEWIKERQPPLRRRSTPFGKGETTPAVSESPLEKGVPPSSAGGGGLGPPLVKGGKKERNPGRGGRSPPLGRGKTPPAVSESPLEKGVPPSSAGWVVSAPPLVRGINTTYD